MIAILLLIAIIAEFMLVRNRPKRFVLTNAGEKIKEKWGYLAVVASAKYSIPEQIILAVIGAESGGAANAININKNGSIDYGLMQVNNRGALADYQNKVRMILDPLEPAQNVEVGSWYLREIHQELLFETWEEKIDAYNVGISGHKQGKRNFNYVRNLFDFVTFV
jgi:soluble lytic murein transglycosylase-like protein